MSPRSKPAATVVQPGRLITRADRALFARALRSPRKVFEQVSAFQAREFSKRHTSLPYQGSMISLSQRLPGFTQHWERYNRFGQILDDLDSRGRLNDLFEVVAWEREAFAAVAAWLACEGEQRRQKGRATNAAIKP